VMGFAELNPDLELNVRTGNGYGVTSTSAWILGGEGSGDPPDILELTPTQMKLFFHHGKIESLGIRESEYQDYLIHSPDGYILGVKTKINPLVVYYNREIFRQHGLELPTDEWGWVQFEQAITELKDKGENVYIYVTPYILEWVTMNRYGGRIVDTSGTRFGGYLDSEEAVQAAEWLFGIKSKFNEYRERMIGGHNTYFPMPYDLIEDNMALAVDYPYYIHVTAIGSYFEILERNENIGIAPLPGGHDVINPALMSGLAIHTGSKNKEAAMALLRYLLEESDDYYRDTIIQTHQWGARSALPVEGSEEWSVILQEASRSVPVSLMLNEGSQWMNNNSQFLMIQLYLAMINDQPARKVLENYAVEYEEKFKEFKEDLNNFYICVKQRSGICRQ